MYETCLVLAMVAMFASNVYALVGWRRALRGWKEAIDGQSEWRRISDAWRQLAKRYKLITVNYREICEKTLGIDPLDPGDELEREKLN